MSNPWDPASQKLARIMRRRRRQAVLRWVALLTLAVAAAAYFWHTRGATPDAPPLEVGAPQPQREPAPTAPPAVETPGETPTAAVETFELPALDESDPVVRDWATRLSSRLELESWLASSDLVRRFVAIVDNVAEGERPARHLQFLKPEESFRVDKEEGRLITDPTSHRRYDLVVEVFTSLDTRATVAIYRRLEPLIDEAYRDLGHPDADFDDTLARAIPELLAAPVVEGAAELTPGITTFEFADPELESLSPVQKQLLRTGPRNVQRVQNKLRAFASALGIPPDALPPPHTYTLESP